MINVLFVCLGNICRSPMAEGHFKKMLEERDFSDIISCDSAGTSSYHIGELPDERMCKTALNYKIILKHRGRQLLKDDFKKFDYIMAMDGKNYRHIQSLADGCNTSCRVLMMRDFDPLKDSNDVPDPYFGGTDGFEEVYSILQRSNEAFLEFLIKEHSLA